MSALAILLSARPKRAKTSTMLAAFPNGLFVGRPSSIREIAQGELGFEPNVVDESLRTLPDLKACLDAWVSDGTIKQFDALVIDDWSLLAKASMNEWEQEEQKKADKAKRGTDVRALYRNYEFHQSHAISTCVNLGMHFGMVCHEREPSDGRPGIPDVPSANQGKNMPAWFDIVARVISDKDMLDPWLPLALYADPFDDNYVTSDRTGVIRPRAPLNLREVLRAKRQPEVLSRLPGLEWQEDIASKVAEAIVGGADAMQTLAGVWGGTVPLEMRSAEDCHLRWACQDGIARATLELRKRRLLSSTAAEVSVSTTPPLPKKRG